MSSPPATAVPRRGHERLLRVFDLWRTAALLGPPFSLGTAALLLAQRRQLNGPALVAAALIGLFAYWALRRNWRWAAAAMAVLTALVAWLTLWQDLGHARLTGGLRALWAGDLLLAGAMLLTLLLAGVRLMVPLKALMLSLAVASSLALSEVAIERLKPWLPAFAAKPGTPTAPVDEETGERLMYEWQGIASVPDKGLQWVYRPHGATKTLYPFNPHNYFDVEPQLGPLDMRIWQVNATEGAKGKLICTTDRQGAVKFVVKRLGTGAGWQLGLVYSHLPIEAGQTYDLTFSARAPQPRGMGVALNRGRTPWDNLGLIAQVKLTESWQEFRYDFAAKSSDEQARLEFQMGAETGDVELQAIRLTPRPALPGPYGALPPSRWSTVSAEGAQGTVATGEDGRTLRAEITSGGAGQPWQFMAVCSQLPLRAGRSYVVSAELRATQPRPVKLAISQARPPWQGMGLYEEAALGTEWQTVEYRFTPTADETNARLEVQLGGHAGAVELRNATLAVADATPEAPVVQPPNWALRQQPGYAAVLHTAAAAPRDARLHIQDCPAPNAAAIQLEHSPHELATGDELTLRFRAKADALRPLSVSVRQGRPPWRALGLAQTIELTADWQEFQLPFVATATDEAAALVFEAGHDSTGVELAAVDLASSRPASAGREIAPDAWRVTAADKAQADVAVLEKPRQRVRCRFKSADAADPWSVIAEAPGGALQAERRYVLSLWARADAVRPIAFGVGPAGDVWSNLLAYQTRELAADWRRLNLEFVTPQSLPSAGLALMLGGGGGWVEWRDARLSPARAEFPGNRSQISLTYTMNEHGYRDVERAVECPDGAFRIACLGDSYTFGQGVQFPDVFTQRLESLLNERRAADEPRYEALNFGVCGYDTVQERTCYESVVYKFGAKAVLLMMVENDDLNYVEERELLLEDDETSSLHAVDLMRQRYYRRTSDFGRCVEEIKRLDGLCRSHGAKLGVCVFRNFNADRWTQMISQVTEGLVGTGVPVLDLGQAILEGRTSDEIVVLPHAKHPIDGHPNHIAHEIVSRELLRFLDQQAWLPRSTAKPEAAAAPEPAAAESPVP